MTNDWNTVLYTGVTNDLERRVSEHMAGQGSKFTTRYRLRKLVYYELFISIHDAIFREKQIKAGSRQKKEALIESINPTWKDLSGEIY